MFSETFSFSACWHQLADRFLRTAIANVIRHGLVIVAPRDVNRARHDQHVLDTQVVCGLGHFPGQFDAALALGCVIAGQRIGPEKERAKAADWDADLVCHFANGAVFLRGRTLGERSLSRS